MMSTDKINLDVKDDQMSGKKQKKLRPANVTVRKWLWIFWFIFSSMQSHVTKSQLGLGGSTSAESDEETISPQRRVAFHDIPPPPSSLKGDHEIIAEKEVQRHCRW